MLLRRAILFWVYTICVQTRAWSIVLHVYQVALAALVDCGGVCGKTWYSIIFWWGCFVWRAARNPSTNRRLLQIFTAGDSVTHVCCRRWLQQSRSLKPSSNATSNRWRSFLHHHWFWSSLRRRLQFKSLDINLLWVQIIYHIFLLLVKIFVVQFILNFSQVSQLSALQTCPNLRIAANTIFWTFIIAETSDRNVWLISGKSLSALDKAWLFVGFRYT